jgi:hypothetical protein
MPESRPPTPGPFVEPNVKAIEDAVRDVTFPISKRELIERIDEEQTIIVRGRNVDLREIVRNLRDDYFESEAEFRSELEDQYGHVGDGAEAHMLPMPADGFPEESARPNAEQPTLPEDNA